MPRVKRGTIGAKRRKNILKQVKGFRFGRSTKEREARTALLHAGVHAFTGRRDKKGDFRTLWQIKINAGVRPLGLSYSVFMGLLKKHKVELDRKILATLAEHQPTVFAEIVNAVKV
ncbi:MAG: 50S ribosomal protein L20 [Patescibacteria group bacterium]